MYLFPRFFIFDYFYTFFCLWGFPLFFCFFSIDFFLFAWSRSLLTVSQFLFFMEDYWVIWRLLMELVPVVPFPMNWTDNGFPLSSSLWISLVYQQSLTWHLVMFGWKMCLWTMVLRLQPNSLNPKHEHTHGLSQFSPPPHLCSYCHLCQLVDWHSPLAYQFPHHWF